MFWKPVIVTLGGVLGAQAADIEGRAIGEVLAGAPSMLPLSSSPLSLALHLL